ncbi:hypothetical protein [Streptomyces sp. CA-111067]|uniref:hypothetical protein n=1 Tax=Streptomyces sp. CA-111067 TaxID=3240046 RepID=UPI003D96F259
MSVLPDVTASPGERRRPGAGDDIVPRPDIVMDRGFDLPAPPHEVWPWIVQLGKKRSGWYLPRRLERLQPPGRRALRHVDPALQTLNTGDVIPDYGRDETFEVALLEAPTLLVHRSVRGRMHVSWAITLTGLDDDRTRVHLRLRLGPVRRKLLVRTVGEFFDRLTIALVAAGLRERVSG